MPILLIAALAFPAGLQGANTAPLDDPDGDGLPGVWRSLPGDPSRPGGPGIAAEDILAESWAGNNSYAIDSQTGAGRLIGPNGTNSMNAASADSSGTVWAAGNGGGLWTLDPDTGALTRKVGIGANSVRGMAFDSDDNLFVVQDGSPDQLMRVDVNTGETTPIGGIGATGIQGACFGPDGTLYAWDISRGLYTVDVNTGQGTDVNPNVGGSGNIQAIAFGPDGVMYGCREALFKIDHNTGEFAEIGGGGYTDVRGIAFPVASVGCVYKLKKSKAKGGCENCPPKGGDFGTQTECETVKDCPKKLKTTIACPGGGNGTCKLKGKRSSCG
ncbi:MAG: hypothetical protein C4547_05215 [Phycisphaerales bacterium]|nr:MAG: hypothetical protein C4547_05215 [Phycisphaerales bacterium]